MSWQKLVLLNYTLTVLAAMTLERPVFKIAALDMYSQVPISCDRYHILIIHRNGG